MQYSKTVFKAFKGIVKLAFLAVAAISIGFISWKGKLLKDHAAEYVYEGWQNVRTQAFKLAKFEEKKRREVLAQLQKLTKEHRRAKKKTSSKESITASEEKRLEELLEKHSK